MIDYYEYYEYEANTNLCLTCTLNWGQISHRCIKFTNTTTWFDPAIPGTGEPLWSRLASHLTNVATQYSWSCFSITSDCINGVQIVVVQALSRVLRFPPHASVSGHTREGLDRGSCHSCITNMHLPHSYPHEYHSHIDIKNYTS